MSTKKQQSARVPGKPNGRIKAAKFAFEGEKLQIPAGEDYTEWIESLYTTFGTTDTDTLCLFADQIQKVVAPGCDDQAKALNQAIPLLLAIKPENEVETMLAAQMIGIDPDTGRLHFLQDRHHGRFYPGTNGIQRRASMQKVF